MTGMNPAEFANIARTERDFWWYRGMRKIFFRLLDPLLAGRKLTSVLEAGCGTGFVSRMLQERGWPVVPIDLSAEGLAFARALGVRSPVQADIRTLPFPDASFDLAISMDVMVHLGRGDDAAAASELARVLRPGGLAAIRVAALKLFRSRHSDFVFERQRFTRRHLIEIFRAAGLRIVRCTYANALLAPVALAKFRVWEPLTRQPVSSGIDPISPWLNALLEFPLACEAVWLGAGLNFPIGQSLMLIAEKPR